MYYLGARLRALTAIRGSRAARRDFEIGSYRQRGNVGSSRGGSSASVAMIRVRRGSVPIDGSTQPIDPEGRESERLSRRSRPSHSTRRSAMRAAGNPQAVHGELVDARARLADARSVDRQARRRDGGPGRNARTSGSSIASVPSERIQRGARRRTPARAAATSGKRRERRDTRRAGARAVVIVQICIASAANA